jgi:predicted lipoprotein with Yx(FWY)xxD motif
MKICLFLVLILFSIKINFAKINSSSKILSLSQISQSGAISPRSMTGPIRTILPLFDTSRGSLSSLTPLNIKVKSSPFGDHLTDEIDISLYVFMGDAPNSSKCTAQCASKWIPFAAPYNFSFSEIERSGRIRWDLIGYIIREDGRRQVTYNNRPLYFYTFDKSPENTLGHGIRDFGEMWYLISPEGNLL